MDEREAAKGQALVEQSCKCGFDELPDLLLATALPAAALVLTPLLVSWPLHLWPMLEGRCGLGPEGVDVTPFDILDYLCCTALVRESFSEEFRERSSIHLD